MYGFSIFPLPNIKMFWNPEDSFMEPDVDFGKYIGMPYSAFDRVRKNIRYGPPASCEKSFDEILHLQAVFNEIMQKTFIPGPKVTVDETTSGWHGASERMHNGPPSLTKMMGKPQPISFMFKDIADAESRVIFRIELQEGKLAMSRKIAILWMQMVISCTEL
jgi:hypothetical protein